MRTSVRDEPCTNHLDARITLRHFPAAPYVSRSRAYALLAGVFVAGMLGATLPTPLYVLYQSEYHFTSAVITVIFGMYAVGVLVALLFLGHTSDHFGRRPVLAAALGVAFVSTLFFVFAQNVPLLLAGRFLSGICAGLLSGTATAALAELQPAGNPQEAARVATAASMGGLGLGALVAGLFAQFAPAPTRLVYVVYLALVVVALVIVGMLPETVEAPDHVWDLRPRVSVPPSARAVFMQAAVAVFCAFTVLGLFTSLASSFLRSTLHQPNLALAGAVVFLLFGTGAVSQLTLHHLTSRAALLAGLVLLLLALALVELGLALPSLVFFLAGTIVAGLGVGLAFMGSLAAINQIAPPGRRAELISAFYVVAYLGITVPVLGVGVLAQVTNLLIASICLAVVVAILLLFTLAALLSSEHGSAMQQSGS
ncbi:MAG TPA: MFS transporter [Ktedonobacterales bacterium]